MEYSTNVSLPYGELGEVVRWCQSHCKYDWNFDIITTAGREKGEYTFQFESEKDYVTFIVWKK